MTPENKQISSQKCDFPHCQKDAIIHFATRDGISHKYCSVEHANDHRNVLITEMLK